ncbi:MAG TPA: ABC transporter permease subunit [Nevskiaceae bacterium]|nr:ABC transporter permease subunit [Nevskiaceae bacterium]
MGRLIRLLLGLYLLAALASPLPALRERARDTSGPLAAAPSAEHWLGTTRNGQDLAARVVLASGQAATQGLALGLATTALGVLLGALARAHALGRHGMQALATLADALPFYLLALALGHALGGSAWALPLAIVLSQWTLTARLLAIELQRIESSGFVAAAQVAGLGRLQRLRHHLLPHSRAVILPQALLTTVVAIKAEVLLGFLGLGSPETVSFGLLLAEAGRDLLAGSVNGLIASGGALAGLVLLLSHLASQLARAPGPPLR